MHIDIELQFILFIFLQCQKWKSCHYLDSGTYRTRKLEVLQILLSIMKLTTSMFSKSKSKMTLILWWMWSILEARPAYSRLWHQRQKGRLCSLLQVRFGAVSEAPTAGSPVEVRPCVTMTIATSLWPTLLIGTRSTPLLEDQKEAEITRHKPYFRYILK